MFCSYVYFYSSFAVVSFLTCGLLLLHVKCAVALCEIMKWHKKFTGPVFPQQINLPLDDLIDELPVEKQHLSKLIIICQI